jgi:hypothetical protein
MTGEPYVRKGNPLLYPAELVTQKVLQPTFLLRAFAGW